MQETQVPFLGWEDPLEQSMQPPPVFLPGESQGWRSLVGYSPQGCKESDTTERLHFTSLQCYSVLVAQSCPTLCDPMDCSLPGFSAHGIFQARMLVDSCFLFQGIFLTQWLNLHFLHCRQILYHLNYQGNWFPHVETKDKRMIKGSSSAYLQLNV